MHRLFKGIDCQQLERVVTGWAERVMESYPPPPLALEAVAIDGKTLCGSQRQGALEVHLLSALSHRLGVVIAQVAVSDRTNEIGQVDESLAALVLEGRIITADSLLTRAQDCPINHGAWR